MQRLLSTAVAALALLTVPVAAQVNAYIPDNNTSAGTCNVIPFGSSSTFSSGYTYVGRIPASNLDPANPHVDEIAFTPCSSGSWSCNTVLMGLGHVPSPVPQPFQYPDVAGTTMGSFLDFTIIYDSAIHGPFNWSVTANQWSPMGFTGMGGTGFTWDGVNDIAFFVTYQSSTVTGWNGAFHRTGTEPFRLYASGYGATQNTGSGSSGLKMCLTLGPPPSPPYSVNVTSTGAGDATLTTIGIPPGTFEGWTIISASTSLPVGTGPHFGITFDQTSIDIFLAFPNPVTGFPLHWLGGVTGVFPDVPFTVPAGTFTPLQGVTWDFVSFAFDITGALIASSSVARITW